MGQQQNYALQQQRPPSTGVLEPAEGRKDALPLPLEATVMPTYEDGQSVAAGVILVIAGVFSIIVTVIGIGLYNHYTFLSHGIWVGIVVSNANYCFLASVSYTHMTLPTILRV